MVTGRPVILRFIKTTTTTIGIDLGDRSHAVCVMDEAGEIRREEMCGEYACVFGGTVPSIGLLVTSLGL